MGRLFWKFFFFTLLAQLIAAAGIGAVIWHRAHADDQRAAVIDTGPPAMFSAEAGAIALEYGGANALRQLIERSSPRHPLYAVRDDGQELLGRQVEPKLVEEAWSIAREPARRGVAREVKVDQGRSYVLFSVREGHLHVADARAREDMPPPEGGSGRDRRGPGDTPPPPPDMAPGAGPGAAFGPPPAPGRGPEPGPRRMMLTEYVAPFGSLFLGIVPVATAIIGSLIFSLGIAWYFSKPIRGLRSAFEAAAGGKLDLRVGASMGGRRDELSDLGRDFDRMANRLLALMEGQRKLLHDVSHELRSPLARMQAAIGLARQDPRKIEASLERVERESMRMDKLVGELLTLSRLEAGVLPAAEESLDVDELLMDVIEDARFELESEADAEKCHIDFSIRSGAVVKGSADWLRRAIENVVRNAVKYSGASGDIVVAAETDRQRRAVTIRVLDRGPGVPESELVAIFEPFFRSNGVDRRQDGHGLGLAIAKRIVEGQGGAIRAFNREDGGLVVEMTLPLA